MPADVDSSAVEMLAKVPIFSTLGTNDLRAIAKGSKERRYAVGDTVVRQGDKGLGFYLILDGKVEVRANGKVLATLGTSEFFGEMPLVDDQPRSADVVATVPCRCLVISSWEFWGFLADKPDVVRLLFKEAVRRLRAPGRGLTE